MSLYKILSIDGGGIRGVIPAVLLTEMEKHTGRSICCLFDLIAGTSTGGILAAGLVAPKMSGHGSNLLPKPKFKASDLLDLYENRGKDIFRRSLWDGIVSAGGLTDEKYPNEGIEDVLEDCFGGIQLKDVLTDILVTSYEIEERKPYFFKSSKAKEDPEQRNHFLRDVARATSAAPTYFEPARVRTVGGSGDRTRYLVDGGVFANNPALCAYAEVASLKVPPDQVLVVSLGTGIATRPIPYKKAKDWGKIGWAIPVLSVIMDGVADAVDYQLRQMLATEGADTRYYRFDTRLHEALDDLDAASCSNINALKREAARILDDSAMGSKFEALCNELAE